MWTLITCDLADELSIRIDHLQGTGWLQLLRIGR